MKNPSYASARSRAQSVHLGQSLVWLLSLLSVSSTATYGSTTKVSAMGAAEIAEQPGYVKSEYVADHPPTRSSHASTVVETKEGLLAAWFGGPEEGDSHVVIWAARCADGRWSAPIQVADGLQAGGTTRYPCWNPVLFQPHKGPLMLFYKVGPSPKSWWGMLMTSTNEGKSWSPPRRLPDGHVGPVRNKPVNWPDGSMVCGASTENHGWHIHLERTADLGMTWEKTPYLNDTREFSAIQPTWLLWPSGKVQILNRTRQGVITECWMGQDWRTWSRMKATTLPNPNSAIDAVVLKDGRGVLVYNHTAKGRSPLNVAVSADGTSWQAALVLENQPGEYSYPAVIQTSDGLVHITHTWNRLKIKHVVIDPARLQPRPIIDGKWPQ